MASLGRLGAAAALVLSAACATVPSSRPLPALAGIPEAFEMIGRIAVRQGERHEIARLRWTHGPGADIWAIATPLGNEVARIESGANGATLLRAGGEPETAPDFASLTERLLGVALTPAMLSRWLHGGQAAAPEGWKVEADRVERAGAVDVARRIRASRGEVSVRLVVDDYRPLPD